MVQENGFPRRLQMLREKRRLSRRTLAELCGLSGNMIGMYERGEKAPSVDALVRLADYFGVSTDYLLGRKNFQVNTHGVTEAQKLCYGFIGPMYEIHRMPPF